MGSYWFRNAKVISKYPLQLHSSIKSMCCHNISIYFDFPFRLSKKSVYY